MASATYDVFAALAAMDKLEREADARFEEQQDILSEVKYLFRNVPVPETDEPEFDGLTKAGRICHEYANGKGSHTDAQVLAAWEIVEAVLNERTAQKRGKVLEFRRSVVN